MTYETLVLEPDGPVARVWLNRPERHNALDARTLEEIADAFAALQERYDAPVVVLGGHGPSFCAGADRKDPPARLTRASGAGRGSGATRHRSGGARSRRSSAARR